MSEPMPTITPPVTDLFLIASGFLPDFASSVRPDRAAVRLRAFRRLAMGLLPKSVETWLCIKSYLL